MKCTLVSIITPVYNSEDYIEATISSVISQTYTNWELIIVDDSSTDGTIKKIQPYLKNNQRIKLIELSKNGGVANARNIGLEHTEGQYIAYLDADDLWHKEKLEKQINFMKTNGYSFTCTTYEVINDKGQRLNKRISMPKSLSYKGLLTNNLIQTVGVMIDIKAIPKKLLYMPIIKRPEDTATWLQILKQGNNCYGLDQVLAYYRRTKGSLSSNKIRGFTGMWFLYRKIENLSLIFSVYCFTKYAFKAVWKRMYFGKLYRYGVFKSNELN